MKKKGKTETVLDYFCPILPYVRFYPTLPIARMAESIRPESAKTDRLMKTNMEIIHIYSQKQTFSTDM